MDILIRWGLHTLAFLQHPDPPDQLEVDPARLADKLGWLQGLQGFQGALQGWGALLHLLEAAESFVHKQGVSRDCQHELQTVLEPWAQTAQTQTVCHQLLAFVTAESLQAQPEERLLGSSEVMESVFGRLKRRENAQAKSGFTGLLLWVCAMVSTTTCEIIPNALESVPTKSVLHWCCHQLGQSLQAKRKQAFPLGDQAEQKPDQLQMAA